MALARNYHKLHCHYSGNNEKNEKNEAKWYHKYENTVILRNCGLLWFIFGSRQFIAGSLRFISSSLQFISLTLSEILLSSSSRGGRKTKV